ncbi:MAG: iron-sulfur cluster assembly protein [Acidobacteriota bacterium]
MGGGRPAPTARAPARPAAARPEPSIDAPTVLRVLATVEDPVLGQDLVALGLVASVEVAPNGRVAIRLCTPHHCSHDGHIEARVRQALEFLPGLRDLQVEIGC